MKLYHFATILFLTISQIHAAEPFIVAHRGASKDAPENTLPAFNLAWQRNADAIEGDFHLTKDGHIVCIHDANTKKTAGVKLEVKDSSLEDLQKLEVGSFHSKKFTGAPIPTLAEVIATVPDGKKIYIEIKCGADIVPYLLKELEKSELKDEQIVIISFKDDVIKAIETEAKKYKTCLLVSIKKNKRGDITPSLETILTRLKAASADGLSASFNITDHLIGSVKAAGYECHTWTVDDPATASRLHKAGIQSITTNVPAQIKKHFSK